MLLSNFFSHIFFNGMEGLEAVMYLSSFFLVIWYENSCLFSEVIHYIKVILIIPQVFI